MATIEMDDESANELRRLAKAAGVTEAEMLKRIIDSIADRGDVAQ